MTATITDIDPDKLRDVVGDLTEDTPSERKKRRARAFVKATDKVAYLWHKGNRRVKRALSMKNLEVAFKVLFVALYYTAAFAFGFFVGIWLYSISVWLYAAFLTVLCYIFIRNTARMFR